MASLGIEELREAAASGDVKFLQKCVNSKKSLEYYLTRFNSEDIIQSGNKASHCYGNILHIAVSGNKEDFIREVIQLLPLEYTQQLLLQPCSSEREADLCMCYPLHAAARLGNLEIVKMFLDVYKGLPALPSDLSQRPWLLNNKDGNTPCHIAVYHGSEECALEILKMDVDLLCNFITRSGSSLVYHALAEKCSKVALEILRSPYSISCVGPHGLTPLHCLHFVNCSEEAEEICRQLLLREPQMIEKTSNYKVSALHHWALDGISWPFKCVLECNDIIPDIKRVFADLVASTNYYGSNPLHSLVYSNSKVSEEAAIEIAKLLIDIYKEEVTTRALSDSENQHPWLMCDNVTNTILSSAIERQYENFAMYIISVDEYTLFDPIRINILFHAITKGCQKVAGKILEIVDNRGWTHLLTTHNYQLNVLHLAPLCDLDFCAQLIEKHPELITRVSKAGNTVLHSWINKGEIVWLLDFFLKSELRTPFIELIGIKDYCNGNNLFHIAATTTTQEATIQAVKLLVEAYNEEKHHWNRQPWLIKNKYNQGPLVLAVQFKFEELALYILSLHVDRSNGDISDLLNYYTPKHSTLFLAIQNNCSQVATKILTRLDKSKRTPYLMDSSNGQNILHLASSLTDVEFGTWLVNEASEFITEQDNDRQSPWGKAFEVGLAWFIEDALKGDPSLFYKEPLAWIKACENGHVSALCALIDHDPGAFRDLCIEHKDSPIHHIQLRNLTGYEEFFKIQRMKDLINVQNIQGETPLHKAIRKQDIFLTETLLNMDKIIYNISDNQNVTSMDLLAHAYEENNAWGHMCKRNGIDPRISTAYFQHKTNLLDVRASLFVVAALLATISFTAGFTLPGGFNQNTGEALLGKKASFLVFLISNTLTLFFSMWVLICLTWSMVYDSSKSLILIDRSMVLLRAALNCTLLAFMTGVYIVVAPKTLWVAILIIVIISSLIGISVHKTFLYKVMDKLFPATYKECRDPLRLMELGYPLLGQSELSSNRSFDELSSIHSTYELTFYESSESASQSTEINME